MVRFKVKRGTISQLDAAAVAGQLTAGEPFLVTDQSKFGLATGDNAYKVFPSIDDVQTMINTSIGSGFQSSTPYIAASPPNPSIERHWYDLEGRHFVWDGVAWFQVGGSGSGGFSGVATFLQQTEPEASSPYIWFKTDVNGNVVDILKG